MLVYVQGLCTTALQLVQQPCCPRALTLRACTRLDQRQTAPSKQQICPTPCRLAAFSSSPIAVSCLKLAQNAPDMKSAGVCPAVISAAIVKPSREQQPESCCFEGCQLATAAQNRWHERLMFATFLQHYISAMDMVS